MQTKVFNQGITSISAEADNCIITLTTGEDPMLMWLAKSDAVIKSTDTKVEDIVRYTFCISLETFIKLFLSIQNDKDFYSWSS